MISTSTTTTTFLKLFCKQTSRGTIFCMTCNQYQYHFWGFACCSKPATSSSVMPSLNVSTKQRSYGRRVRNIWWFFLWA
ncbi:hypothetical protein LINGRAHAP2_LOCUS33673 [Linum grandiflorum]